MLDVQKALVSVRPEWERLSDNHYLYQHLTDVQNLLKLCKAPVRLERPPEVEDCRGWYPCWKPGNVRPRMQDLLIQRLGVASATNGRTNGNHVNGGYRKARKMVNVSRFITEGKYSLIPINWRCSRNQHSYLSMAQTPRGVILSWLLLPAFLFSTQSCLLD